MVRKELSITVDTPQPSPATSKRMTFPDVPEDIDAAAQHWNDPNFDIYNLPSPTHSTVDTLELEAKSTRHSAGYAESDFDRDSRLDSSKVGGSQSSLRGSDYDE